MLAELKKKTCKVCRGEFIPFRPMQTVCGQKCALKTARAERKRKVAETRERKAALKRIPDLKREAQTAFNAWVRARDEKQPCISCGKPPGDMTELHAGRDAGHYRSTGTASHLRFHEDNCHAQCVKCNQWQAGNAVDYRIGLVARIGRDRVENLESNNTPHKWEREELIEIKRTYRLKLRELKARTE